MRTEKHIALGLACTLAVCVTQYEAQAADVPAGLKPVGKNGQPLNLDFEDGTLRGWTATGPAFDRQPIKGDTVSPRRSDMKSQHQGDYWIGTYEIGGDEAQGTLTSVPFKVTHPYASFLVAGGPNAGTRVEIVRADTQEIVFKATGYESEALRPVVVDLQSHPNKEIFIRIIDNETGGWGHINFDNFVFHATKPVFANALDPAKLTADAPPPADVVKFAGLSAEQAAKEITGPAGFKGHLFAGEPDVRQPIAFALDDRGRVWVAEGFTYPKRAPEGQGKDRILVFEDTDGDHKFDKRTVFKENLNLVSGLEVGFGGVWVGAAPYLMFIPDRNGDDIPDGEPEILLDGWDYKADTHETLNTFTWGPDGWLYGCHGVFCPSFVGKPGTPDNERQRVDAAVWRYHPVKRTFEVFAEGTSNPWGVDFNEYGQCVIEACVIPHLWHMIQGGRYERQGGQHYNITLAETQAHEKYHKDPRQRHVHPFIYDDIKTIGDHVHYAGNKGPHAANGRSDAMGGGHAHAGLMVYLGDSFPDEYRGKAFMNNIHGQRLNMDILERRGSGYVGKHGPDFIKFNDTWSQVLNMLYDQDGSVYMIDWYDKNQCHHNREDGHDRGNGRIFKLVYNDAKVTRVDLQKLSDDELVQLQLHQNDWHVRHARRILQERAAKNGPSARVHQALTRILRENPDTTRKLRALWALHVTGGFTGRVAVDNVKSSDEWVRAWTVQLAFEDRETISRIRREIEQGGVPANPDLYEMAESDPSAVVRLYIAAAAQRAPTDSIRANLVKRLLQRSEDAGDHNIPLMVWYAMEPLVEKDPSEALTAAVDAKLPRILNFTTRRVAAIGTPEAYAAIARALDGVADEKRQLEMLNGLSTALKGQRSVPMPNGWEALETKLAESRNSEVRALAQSISLTFGSQKELASLRKTLTDPSADLGVRRMAMDSLLSVRDANLAPVLQQLLKESSLRGPALRGLAAYDDARTPAAILAVYPSFNAGEKRDALNTLASRVVYGKELLAAISADKISNRELTADLVRQLRNLKNADIDQDLAKVWGVARESSADMQKEIEKYKRIYWAGGSTPGDALRGRVVYAKTCQQCHTLFDSGGHVGPDLTGSNRGDLDYILQNMVDPNAVIPNEYRSSTIEMKDERVLTGIVKKQDANVLTIATANETVTVPRSEVQTVQVSEISMMPEGLLENLQDQEIRDLIYYLSRPGQVPLLGTADTAGYFFNGKDLSGWDGNTDLWRVENGEIVGSTATGLKENEFLKSQMLLGDFRLVCKVKLTPNKENSGIQFRSEALPDGSVKGYQADIGAGWWGKLYEEHGREILWNKSGEPHVKVEDWNTYEIIAVGDHIRTFINGQPCVDLQDPKGAKQGIIAFQLHSGGPMEIRIKDIELEVNPKTQMSKSQ